MMYDYGLDRKELGEQFLLLTLVTRVSFKPIFSLNLVISIWEPW